MALRDYGDDILPEKAGRLPRPGHMQSLSSFLASHAMWPALSWLLEKINDKQNRDDLCPHNVNKFQL